ncbi:hypothetical protein OC846_006537 [Tilletia horrida]|uniref:Uncharacterized protein n=1 Tax=Tilletia horrida TaxID=155126 RepID=A0AAN6JQI8_9BASI|nr:hypothetical protein OC846_006537 [Tilletia horrida]KAK0559556.1 hypothetical protein OC861_006605 [Tilletia horrida]
MAERGREAGRDPIIATGRGGAGNMIRSPSRGRGATDLPPAKAVAAAHNPAVGKVVHAGRGGAGNVRSPSRDPLERQRVREAEEAEHKLQADYAKNEASHFTATGRGGAGNISVPHAEAPRGRDSDAAAGGAVGNILRSLSRSRSRSREPRPTDRRRPSADATERSQSRTRGDLPSVSEHASGGTVGVLAEEEDDAAPTATAPSAATKDAAPPQSIKDRILNHLPGHQKS